MSEPTLGLLSIQSLVCSSDTCGLLEVSRNLERVSTHRRCCDPVEQNLLPADGFGLVLIYLEL